MKKKYTAPEYELILFNNADVITASNEWRGDEIDLPFIEW